MEERIGLGIGAGTERTCGKLIIFGLAVIAFATTHGSQRGVQFAPKRSDQIHHNIHSGIQNPHMHFGDYDFADINIYLQEYKRHLGTRTRFFMPPDLEDLIARHGNRKIYDSQKANFTLEAIEEPEILQIIALLHKYKKGLEQEALIWL